MFLHCDLVGYIYFAFVPLSPISPHTLVMTSHHIKAMLFPCLCPLHSADCAVQVWTNTSSAKTSLRCKHKTRVAFIQCHYHIAVLSRKLRNAKSALISNIVETSMKHPISGQSAPLHGKRSHGKLFDNGR